MLFLLPMALAGELTLLPTAPIIPDGEPVTLLISAPGVTTTDKVKAKPYEGTLVSATIVADGLVQVVWTPPDVHRDEQSKIRVSLRGGMKLDEDLSVSLTAPPKGSLEISAVPGAWTAGTRQQTTLVVKAQGGHSLPLEARSVAIECTDGKVGPVKADGDGTWSAIWTPPAPPSVPTNVLCTATDLTAPGLIQGWGSIPVLVKKTQTVSAPAGSQNVLIIGDQQFGPVTAKADGTVEVDAVLDPRVAQGMLQSVDTTGYRTDSTVDLKLGSPAQMAFAPLPQKVPAGASLTVAVAMMNPDGSVWDGAAPSLEGAADPESVGKGWFLFDVTAPQAGAWTLQATGDCLEATASTTVIDAVPSVSVSADPATLGESDTAFSVTAHLKDASGTALTKEKPVFTATNATPVGAFKDNGDGTYTQNYKLGSGGDAAVVQVHAMLSPTGLPVARVLAWPRQASTVSPGSTTDLAIVALDALGMPVPNAEIKLSTPVGDGALPPTVTTDKYGTATVSLRAGSETGPLGVLATANGVRGGAALYVGEGAVPSSSDWTSHWPQVGVARGAATVSAAGPAEGGGPPPAEVGPPAALTITTVPAFTTPGAAILVNVTVVDAKGFPVNGAAPTIASSLGTVGQITDNGDGTYTLPLQLPPGQDGPVQITGMAGSAQGSLVLPTLENAGSLSNSGGNTKTPRPPRQSSDVGGKSVRVRFLLMDMSYTHTATSSGDASVPSEVSYKKGYPLGVLGAAVQIEGWVPYPPVGFDARVKAGRYRLTVADINYADAVYPAMAGLRFRGEVAPGMAGYAGLWAHALDVPIFRYAEDNTPPLLLSKAVYGGRLGGGFSMETDLLLIRMEVAETFAPYPVNSHAGLGIDIFVAPEIGSFVHIGAEVDQQHMTFRVGDGALADDVKLRSRQATLFAGFGGAF